MAPNERDHLPAAPRECVPPDETVPEQMDRRARFLARLDTYLSTIANDAARLTFIDRQLALWQRRYGRFIATQGASEPVIDASDPPQAADFLLTITELAARRRAAIKYAEPKKAVVAAMTEPPEPPLKHNQDDDKILARALLSLLVAADQRCPAIIGQAHLLYHVRPAARPDHVKQTFAQLKRDADDLIRAIAKVEAAMKS